MPSDRERQLSVLSMATSLAPQNTAEDRSTESGNSSKKRLNFLTDGSRTSVHSRLQEFGYSKAKRMKSSQTSSTSDPLSLLDDSTNVMEDSSTVLHSPIKNPFAKSLTQFQKPTVLEEDNPALEFPAPCQNATVEDTKQSNENCIDLEADNLQPLNSNSSRVQSRPPSSIMTSADFITTLPPKSGSQRDNPHFLPSSVKPGRLQRVPSRDLGKKKLGVKGESLF